MSWNGRELAASYRVANGAELRSSRIRNALALELIRWTRAGMPCRNKRRDRGYAGTDASWLLPIGSRTVLRLRSADRGTRAVAVRIASGSDVNGKLRSSRIRNALGLELIRWTRAGMPCRNKRRDRGYGLIDAGTAASLQTPTSSQGDHATERSNEPTVRELGESSVQGHEVVSRVERSEDATAPLVLDRAPSMANLVVSEESLISILGVSDVNPTPPLGVKEAGSEPVDLLELSDSSAEEEGGEKSDERVPGDNPQGKEEGVVDEVENPPASTTDEAGGVSDQLEA
ncbi:hypothetical protein F2Q70_00042272 [Brassica cretica]|uniref:Uncharacterized protein n=1 Tax=Brassica cretica TaxID=69181 RepID=A0A8S9KIN6_BRACR|nr:hypothetical protein F2Q70_00042272 [Brassica cretica]